MMDENGWGDSQEASERKHTDKDLSRVFVFSIKEVWLAGTDRRRKDDSSTLLFVERIEMLLPVGVCGDRKVVVVKIAGS